MTIWLNGFVLLVGTAEHALCNSIHEQCCHQKPLGKPNQGDQCHTTSCGVATSHALRSGTSSIELD
jgi:hypothetical protein